MEANDFVARLKADSSQKCNCDLPKVTDDYKSVLTKLPAKDRGLFGLNVVRILCWNLEKAPKWRDNIDNTALLTLAIDCIRETRTLDKEDRVKALVCIYHVHKYAVRLNKPVPPELVLKVSFMPFELDSKHLLKDYHKTYWNILSERISYIERLKSKVNIVKLLPKLTDDITKVIQIYDTRQFCSTIIVYLVKKLHCLYSENYSKELSQTFKEIFVVVAEEDDVKLFKEQTEKETFDVYMKLIDSIYIIADNSSKLNFKDGILDDIVRTCISLVGHQSDIFHCLQTFYLNCFCSIISEKCSATYVDTTLNSLENSLHTTEKLGYGKTMIATYPYVNQLLRLFIENNIANAQKNKAKFTLKIQEICLKLILHFMTKLKDCDQILKCENCPVKTGLHDSLRLSFLVKHFITISVSQKIVITSLFETLNSIINEQYKILIKLNELRCINYQKYFRKLQTDVHNSAICLNKALYFEFSIKLFDIYLTNELKCSEKDKKNISRAFFNKSICELDSKLYQKALIDAFLSLIYAQEESFTPDKYMSLVMDIKAKELKSKNEDDDDEDTDDVQLISVLDACKMAMENEIYGDIMPYVSQLKFSVLLRHEFNMYCKLWPSMAPVAGVWRSLHDLAFGLKEGFSDENQAAILEVLYDVILETPSSVRTIHNPHYSTIVRELLDKFDNMPKARPDEKAVHAALLFLQCEYDMASASHKHEWKSTDASQSMNPDQVACNRTVLHEHTATNRSIVATQLLRDLLPDIGEVSRARLGSLLQVAQIFVQLLLQLSRDASAAQLAYICCHIAEAVHDFDSYVLNAGVLLQCCQPSSTLDSVIKKAAIWSSKQDWAEARLMFLCDVALHSISRGAVGTAARMVRVAQTQICDLMKKQPDIKLDLAIGRLLEAQTLLCDGSGVSELSAVNSVQRHYLALTTTGMNWSRRRLRQLTVRVRASAASRRACALAGALGLRSRARACAAAVLGTEGAVGSVRMFAMIVDVASVEDTQLTIDNRIKRILGLQSSNETHPCTLTTPKKPQFTPKTEVETMRDIQMLKKAKPNPALPWESVPALKIPDFLRHNDKCTCYACDIPTCMTLACKSSCLEAATYSFLNENEIARNYFEGVLDMIKIAEIKFSSIERKYKEMYDDFIVKSVMNKLKSDFKTMQIESLIDSTFFEIKCQSLDVADGYIVEIHEVMQEIHIDKFLKNNVMNLMAASARMKENAKKPVLDLDEFENLVISPREIEKSLMTPEKTDFKPPKQRPSRAPKGNDKIVKDEEMPKKRLIIKQIKLDEVDDENDFEKPTRNTRKVKKDAFKVPDPKLSKIALEEATPKPVKTIPKLKVTSENTPNANKENNEFFTPLVQTPEQFFTPMTSVKTYTKKSLRHNIVKNLEQQFSTPKTGIDKENKKIGEKSSQKETTLPKNLNSKESKDKEANLTAKVTLTSRESSTIKDSTKKKDHTIEEVTDRLNVPRSSRKERSVVVGESNGKLSKEKTVNPRPRQMRQANVEK